MATHFSILVYVRVCVCAAVDNCKKIFFLNAHKLIRSVSWPVVHVHGIAKERVPGKVVL